MKRTIEISTRGTRLYIADSRLVIEQEDEILTRIPTEDIGVLILDSTGVHLTSGALKALAAHGAAILSCDDRHHPHGMFLPLAANSLHSERIRNQVSASDALCRNLWSRVVRAKVKNQATLLSDQESTLRLQRLLAKIRSGDPDNIEAQAGRFYWASFFGDAAISFRRRRAGAFPNSLLNYGYAVLRAATARALCAAGLHPGLGIHHRNRYSGYCLADDLMEPYRPWIDQNVRTQVREGATSITKEGKASILQVLATPCRIDHTQGPLIAAIERSAASLAATFTSFANGGAVPKASQLLLLPSFIQSHEH